jgi:hypothetical protein
MTPLVSLVDERQLSFAVSYRIALTALALCIALVVSGIALYRKRGWLVAIAAIPALIWPALYLSLMVGCLTTGGCL